MGFRSGYLSILTYLDYMRHLRIVQPHLSQFTELFWSILLVNVVT